MQHLTYEKALFAFVVASLIFCVFMFLATTKTITNVSAVEANGVGVYWDSNCSNRVSSIDWGTLNPGSVKNIAVYIRNEEEEPMYLILSTANWNPPEASEFLDFGWAYIEGRQINPGEAFQITLSLSVSRYIKGISNFSFDILVAGSDLLPGDATGDGTVNFDDVLVLAAAYLAKPPDPNYDPRADFDGDGDVDFDDVLVLATYYHAQRPR